MDRDAYQNLINDLMEATRDSGGDSEVVYPLLQANLDKLDNNFLTIWREWTEAVLSQPEPAEAESIARDIWGFCNLILEFPLGSKRTNMEISIVGYDIMLTVFTRDGNPENWASIQNNLGNAYLYRIAGDRAENLELAIASYQQALQVRTKEAFPIDWAATQNNLAIAYSDRIAGDRAENLELAIASYEKALQVRTKEAFPINWANVQNNLAIAYQNRIAGDRAENLELAIASYQQALQVITKEAFPIDWATTQNNLGTAYWDRIAGDRAENLELAIASYQQALQVSTKEAFPIQWAMTQNNLGTAYRNRIAGDSAENLELAIASYQQALQVSTKEAFPIQWAMTQNNLGTAYRNRIAGDSAENLELAIASYQQALQVSTKEAFPIDWAGTQNNLGGAYLYRIAGDSAENLELAIASYQQALEVSTKEAFPIDWATTQNNLGNAYGDRIAGDRAENLELAIASYQQALQVRTKEAFPIQWATTQNNLGSAYGNRIAGDRAENLELAIASYKRALEVRTKEAFPIQWAMAQNNLGLAYSDRIAGDRAENLELAIASYKRALEVRTKEAFPIQWATTQNNLGSAHLRAENLELAIASFQQALQVRTPETLPLNCLQTARNLGNLQYREGNWQRAIDAYETAAEAIDRVWQWAPTEERREQILTDELELYQNLVQSYLNIEETAKALATVERTKSRNLLELVANLDIDPEGEFPPELLEELNRLRRAIFLRRGDTGTRGRGEFRGDEEKADTRQTPHTSHTPHTPHTLRQELGQLQQQLDGLLEEINRIDPGFSLTQRVETMTAAEIGELVADGETAIIEWFVTGEKLVAFVVFQGTGNGERGTGNAGSVEIRVKEYAPQQLRRVAKRANGYYRLYRRRDNRVWWLRQLQRRMDDLAEILQIAELVALIPEKCQRLILIPHLYLHLLPLHGLGDLFSRFPKGVQYAPSCQLLRVAQRRGQLQPQQPRNFFAIQNPTEDLSYTDLEVASVAKLFQPQTKVLAKTAAGKSQLKGEKLGSYNHHHFSCHGYFDTNNPKLSALILADAFVTASATRSESRYLELRDGRKADIEQCLTWGEIAELDLRQTRLVVLSACETGLTKFNFSGEEYIGLPSALIIAGATNAIVTLWTVNDLATAFLTIQFYYYYLGGCPPALALNRAQIWLRDVTKEELKQWIEEKELSLNATQRFYWKKLLLNNKEESERPFEEPYYWAGFCAIGR